jgi:hypothetical protein
MSVWEASIQQVSDQSHVGRHSILSGANEFGVSSTRPLACLPLLGVKQLGIDPNGRKFNL